LQQMNRSEIDNNQATYGLARYGVRVIFCASSLFSVVLFGFS